ncbi:MAG: 7-carboxy-7-deazaguanine synthase [Dehalococcoidia bacterium]|nr:7-carboxy-7-deazaguanine synthase [Dehalococcoidia bacterium]
MEGFLEVSRKPDGRPEIFHSIQGEGINTGRPAVFLRLARCNLACVWCDTKYTWDWERYDPGDQILEMASVEVEREVLGFGCKYLVVTGGEPMLQQRRLILLLKRLKNGGFYIEMETNGTVLPDKVSPGLVDHWSVSPKLENSGNPRVLREAPACYNLFGQLPSCQFKYVIQNEDDLEEVDGIVRKYHLPVERVLLMPQARTRQVLLDKSRWLAEICKARGYLFSTRLHILLWGDKRGV